MKKEEVAKILRQMAEELETNDPFMILADYELKDLLNTLKSLLGVY